MKGLPQHVVFQPNDLTRPVNRTAEEMMDTGKKEENLDAVTAEEEIPVDLAME